jgi:Ca2+-binding EF-hand superfamily protein
MARAARHRLERNQTMTAFRPLPALALAGLLAACATPAPGTTAGAAGPARPVGGHGHAAFMGSFDANRDGVVTRAEYDAVRQQRFLDANGDGWLSEDEYVAEFEGRLKRQYDGRAPDDAHAREMAQARVRFKVLDTDKDGRLTAAEAQAMADKTFRAADVNGDGRVDAADATPPAPR